MQIEELVSISSLKSYTNGYLLHYEKTNRNRLLFLVDGLAKAYKIDKRKNEIFLYYIYSGRIVSEISTLRNDYLTSYSNIQLLQNSQILSIDYQQFKKQFLNNGLLSLELANEVIRQSKQLQDLVNREIIFDSVSKVAMALDSDIDMFNRVKRSAISLMLHIQPSTLSRVLNRLKRNNIIDIVRGEVIIVNQKALNRIYDE
jgi:CRP/FNR family transcriptional regulator